MFATRQAVISTLLHVLELVFCLGASLALLRFAGLEGEGATAVTTLAIGAVAKFARSHEDIPVGDYVNDR